MSKQCPKCGLYSPDSAVWCDCGYDFETRSQRPKPVPTTANRPGVLVIRGVDSVLEVFNDHVAITPKGVLGFFNKGLKGTKDIPFTSIAAIQLKKPGITSGYIQFTIPGGNESRRGLWAATSDENTFLFTSDVLPDVERAKNLIEQRQRQARTPVAAPAATTVGIADELAKLADLHRQGVLSDVEFGLAKQRLIERR